jgi:hypothetical protein
LPEALVGQTGAILQSEEPVPGQYIVVLKDDVARRAGDRFIARPTVREIAQTLALAYEGTILYVYEHALRGFAVRMPEAKARLLANDSRVAWVQEDGRVRAGVTQTSPVWGLDRIDQRNLPLDSKHTYNTGAGFVHAYVLDTGIRPSHLEFDVRVSNGYTAFSDGNGTNDCNGHGTHVAGTLGGVSYGVAKGVTLHPVRVLNCSGGGTSSSVVAGVNWVTGNHVKPAVANMSLWGGPDSAIDTAVRNSIAAGVTYAVIAGNANASACNYSPARVSEAITVGATTSGDSRASYSNFGTCVDVFAPGHGITSAWNTSNTATNVLDGTSMASPHVAGVAALYLKTNGTASPSQVWQAILNHATLGRLSSIGSGSPNRLLHSGLEAAPACTPCGESGCTGAEGAYISHFTGLGCTGEEHYYTPYFNSDGVLRSWDGQGCVGADSTRSVTNRSYRDWNGQCWDAWPGGNPLTGFAKIYRLAPCSCSESVCTPASGAYISHFTGLGCTGEEYYYTPYDRNDGRRRPWDSGGCAGTVLRTVTNRSYRDSVGICYDAWPGGNTLSGFVRIYR